MHRQNTADTTRATDMELVQAAKSGKEQAYQQLVTRYQRQAIAVALGILHDRDEAEDIAQEAFARVFTCLDRFQGKSGFYTWLYRITVNLAIDRSRRLNRLPAIPKDEWDDMADTQGRGPESQAIDREIGRNIQAAIQELSPEHRAVLVLRAIEGLSFSEIAATVGISLGTALSRMHYARKQVREFLQKGERHEASHVDGEAGRV